MAYISKIQLPSGNEYQIKDAEARKLIEDLGSPMHFIGVTTEVITDGGVENPNIDGYNVLTDRKAGDVIVADKKEYVWDGNAWREFGDLSHNETLKSFAYVDEGTANYTPKGTVTVELGEITGEITTTVTTATGTVSKPTFKGSAETLTDEAEVTGTVTSTFTGETNTSTGKFTPKGNISEITPAGSVSITPETSDFVTVVAAPTVSSEFKGTSATINATTNANAFTAEVEEDTLILKVANGTITGSVTATGTVTSTATAGTSTTAKAVTKATASFSGTKVTPQFTGTEGDVSVTGKAAGSIKSSLESATANVSISYTPSGSVSQPTFTGDKQTATSEIEIVTNGATGSFEGENATITVSPKKN